MLRHFWSWVARKTGSEAHIAFGEARRLYQSYVYSLRKQFDHLDDSDFAAARGSADLARTEQLYRRARRHAVAEGRSDNVATADYQLGLLFHLQGRLAEAEQRLQRAADSLQASLTDGPVVRSTLSGCLYHLGIIAMRNGNLSEAKRLLHESLEIDEADLDLGGVAACKSALETVESWSLDTRHPMGESGAVAGDGRARTAARAEPVTDRLREHSDLGGSSATLRSDEFGESVEKSSGRPTSPSAVDTDEQYFAVSDITNVLWLLSHSVRVNDIYMEELERQLGTGVSRKLRVYRGAFGSADESQATLPQVASDERLCGAILILEKEALRNNKYLRWADLCVSRVARSDDFRLFAGAPGSGSDLGEYERSAGLEGRQLIDEITQMVQFAVDDQESVRAALPAVAAPAGPTIVPGPVEVCSEVLAYLQDVDGIRWAALWRKLRLSVAGTVGRLALLAQVAALSSLVLIASTYMVLGIESSLTQWVQDHREFVGLLVGILLFPLNTMPLFFVLRGLRAMYTFPQRRPDLFSLFILLMLTSMGLSFLVEWYEVPVSWILLGLCAGLILDHARRIGIYVRRARISLEKCLQSSGEMGPLGYLLARGVKMADHPLMTPLFPANRPRVFISYGRRLRWSEGVAHKLHQMLVDQGTVSFLDEGIGIGSSWRAALNRQIADADVLISVVQQETLRRKWVAAELIAAVVGRATSGSPRIVVLTPPGMEGWAARSVLPVFAAVIRDGLDTANPRKPRVLRISGDSLVTIASGLRPAHYETASVIPAAWSLILRYLAMPVVGIGPLSTVLGLPALFFFYLEYWNKTNLGSFLAEWSLLEAACILGGYLAGFCARLVASTVFEMRRVRRRGPAIAHAMSCAGLAAIVILWCQDLAPLFIGWTITLGCAGWYLAGSFLGGVKLVKPELFNLD